jgi:hypothetical protein
LKLRVSQIEMEDSGIGVYASVGPPINDGVARAAEERLEPLLDCGLDRVGLSVRLHLPSVERRAVVRYYECEAMDVVVGGTHDRGRDVVELRKSPSVARSLALGHVDVGSEGVWSPYVPSSPRNKPLLLE